MQAKNAGKLSGKEVDSVSLPTDKNVVYKKRSAAYGIEDISFGRANSNTIYAGSLLKISRDGTQLPR